MSGSVLWIVIAALVVLFLLTPAKPSYYRRRPLSFVQEIAPTLFLMSEGSTLVIELEGSKKTLIFRKARDTDSAEQQIFFEFPSEGWSDEDVEVVLPVLQASHGAHLATDQSSSSPNSVSSRQLRVGLHGKIAAVGPVAHDLLVRLAPALGISAEDRFTFHVEGLRTQAIWRRVNESYFVTMADSGPSWLHRRFARRQLDRLRHERKR